MTEEPKISSSFWLRRLHSLSGVFPIGVFLLEHMFTNSFILQGPEAYNSKIEFLRSLPYLPFIEITFIGLPILYHAGYGMYVWFTGKIIYAGIRTPRIICMRCSDGQGSLHLSTFFTTFMKPEL